MRILLIEDNMALAEATVEQLRQAGYEVDHSPDGELGLYYMVESAYDLVILDRMLPELDGLSVLRQARLKGIHTPVILMTALDRIGDRVDGLDAGADDYLVKPFDVRELLARVRALARRPGSIRKRQEITFGTLVLDKDALTLEGDKARCTLSKKEGEFLGFLMENGGQALSRSLLFGRIWGPDADVDDSILDSYAHFIRRRLDSVSDRMKLVTVRGVGYRLEEQSC